MSACYYVNLKVKVRDEQGIVNALKNKILQDEANGRADYSLDAHTAKGTGMDTMDDLMKIFLADWEVCDFEKNIDGDTICYTNGFNASYGWETIMMDMFEIMTPFLYDGSKFRIDIENDYDRFVVRNGKCVQTH